MPTTFTNLGTITGLAQLSKVSYDRYWVGGSGNWSDDTNHWADVSGGTPKTGNLPDLTMNVFIDDNSGFGSGGTISGDTALICKDFTITTTDTFTIENTSGGDFQLYGDMTLTDNVTITGVGLGTDVQTALLDTKGKVFNYMESFGKVTLLSDFEAVNGFSIYNYFDANDFNVTGERFMFNSQSTTSFTVKMGSGTWEATSDGGNPQFWIYSNQNEVTINSETSTLLMSGTGSGDKVINWSDNSEATWGCSLYNFEASGGTGLVKTLGNFTFNDFTIGNTQAGLKVGTYYVDEVMVYGQLTFNGTFDVSGTGSANLTINSDDETTQHILSKASGTVDCSYLDLSNSNATGGATWNATNSNDTVNNTGWNIT